MIVIFQLPLSCNFEEWRGGDGDVTGCGWYQDTSGDFFNWKRGKGHKNNKLLTGPAFDHTYMYDPNGEA